MNVYDFDKTIYNGDSTVDFYLYAVSHNISVLRFIPKQIGGIILYLFKRIDKTGMKEYFFSFLMAIDVEKTVNDFWCKNIHKIYDWYTEGHLQDDIVISASPEFLLSPVCQQLHISHLIASRVDPFTGKFNGKNCRGGEKVERLHADLGEISIEKFYSDSLSDLPLASLAKKAYLIKNGKATEWKL